MTKVKTEGLINNLLHTIQILNRGENLNANNALE